MYNKAIWSKNVAAQIIKKQYKKLKNDDEFYVFDFDVITAYSRYNNTLMVLKLITGGHPIVRMPKWILGPNPAWKVKVFFLMDSISLTSLQCISGG